MDLVEISRRLENIIRLGTVHSVDHDTVRCRVQSGRLVTQWLPWFAARAGETRTWDPPTVGEQAVVLSPSGEAAAGIVFYGINSDAHPAPSDSPDRHLIKYPDGATVAYDHASGHLSATGIQTADIQADTSITLTTPLTLIHGEVRQTGGPLSSNGIVLHNHHHTGVETGGGQSGGPQ